MTSIRKADADVIRGHSLGIALDSSEIRELFYPREDLQEVIAESLLFNDIASNVAYDPDVDRKVRAYALWLLRRTRVRLRQTKR